MNQSSQENNNGENQQELIKQLDQNFDMNNMPEDSEENGGKQEEPFTCEMLQDDDPVITRPEDYALQEEQEPFSRMLLDIDLNKSPEPELDSNQNLNEVLQECGQNEFDNETLASHAQEGESTNNENPEEAQEDGYNSWDDRDDSVSEDSYHENNYRGNDGSFKGTYHCFPMSATDKPHLEDTDQIIMPPSALQMLVDNRMSFPMLFEISNESKECVSHCGVSEFVAGEGLVYLPLWMMQNLQVQEGNIVNLKNVDLQKGTFIKMQPHSMDFLEIRNPRAALEEALSTKFFCLTTGDTIMINHNNKSYYINIVETKPAAAVCIIDTDCEVDFAPPLDYKEPEKPPQTAKEEPMKKGSKFVPFTGLARRLDGNPSTKLSEQTIDAVPVPSSSTESELKLKCPGKLVFGSSKQQNKSREVQREDKKVEALRKKDFQPFSGKKYSLLG